MAPQSRFILNNQQQLHILEWPCLQASEKNCLLLHGFSNNAYIWSTTASKLREKYNVYALDFRGHGDSQWSDSEQYSHSHFVEDLNCAIKNLQLDNLHLIGHSLGARVAALYLAQNAHKINSFTIIDTGPVVNQQGSLKIRNDIEATPQFFSKPEQYLKHLSSIYWLAQAAILKSMAKHDLKKLDDNKWQLKLDPKVCNALWSNSPDQKENLAQSLWDAFNNITIPCLILRGQISSILRKETAQAMHHSMKNSIYQNVSKAGHAVMCDNPEETVEFIWRFLQEIDSNF